MPSPRRILLLLASMVGAGLVGWIAAASLAPETRARSRSNDKDIQVELLMQQLQDQDELNDAERSLMLERLVTLDRLQEAEVVLQPWLSGLSSRANSPCSKRNCNVAMAARGSPAKPPPSAAAASE